MLSRSGLRDSHQYLTEHYQVWWVLQQKTEASLFLIAYYLPTSTAYTILFTICTYNGHTSHSYMLVYLFTDWLTALTLTSYSVWMYFNLFLYVYCLTYDFLPILYYNLWDIYPHATQLAWCVHFEHITNLFTTNPLM